MALSVVATKNMLASAFTGAVGKVGLHSGDPGVDGTANELTGSGYARGTLAWGAVSNGAATGTSAISVPASSPTWVSLWDAAGTTFREKAQITSPEVWVNPGTANVSVTYTQS